LVEKTQKDPLEAGLFLLRVLLRVGGLEKKLLSPRMTIVSLLRPSVRSGLLLRGWP
jgi:hypothetical protein